MESKVNFCHVTKAVEHSRSAFGPQNYTQLELKPQIIQVQAVCTWTKETSSFILFSKESF